MKIVMDDGSDMTISDAISALTKMQARYGNMPILDLEGFVALSLTGPLGKAEVIAFLCKCDCHGCKTRGHENE